MCMFFVCESKKRESESNRERERLGMMKKLLVFFFVVDARLCNKQLTIYREYYIHI